MSYSISDQQFGLEQQQSKRQWWVWGLIAIVACCGLLCIGAVGFFAYFGQAPENLSAEYSMPSIVANGENFDLIITLTNSGTEPILVGDIDLDESFGGSILDGAIVLTTEPDMQRDYSLGGIKTFKYNRSIPPGTTETVVFHLQATTIGEFGGSIGIYVGAHSVRFDYVSIIVQE